MDQQVQRLVDKVWDKFQQTPPDRRFSELLSSENNDRQNHR